MRYKILLFLLLTIVINHSYSRTILLEVPEDGYWADCSVVPEDGNLLKYSSFNLVDGNLSTAGAINTNGHVGQPLTNVRAPYFTIFFKENYPVDKIVVYNGYQKNKDIYLKNNRVKELFVIAIGTNYREELINRVYKIYDKFEGQEIIFEKSINAKDWTFFVLSTYPGTEYDDICISEIEFWYKGEKYKIGNLEEAKKEFLQKVREEVRKTITMYATPYEETGSIEMEPLIKVPFEGLKARWKSLGVEVDKIEMKSYVIGEKYGDEAGEYTMCLVNFVGMDGVVDKTVKGFKGKIVAEAKNGYGKRYKFGRDYINVIQIGEWKIDEYGNLWIKIGKGEWKKAKKEGWRILTGDTDLGEIKF